MTDNKPFGAVLVAERAILTPRCQGKHGHSKYFLGESYQEPSLNYSNVAMRIASCSLSCKDMSSSCVLFAKVDLLNHDSDGRRKMEHCIDATPRASILQCLCKYTGRTPFRQPISIRRIGRQIAGCQASISLGSEKASHWSIARIISVGQICQDGDALAWKDP